MAEGALLDSLSFHQFNLMSTGNNDVWIGDKVQIKITIFVVNSIQDDPHSVESDCVLVL